MKKTGLLTTLFALLLWILPVLPAQAGTLPEQAYISGIIGHAQSYSLSCESRSAADWAAFWGVEISEQEFLDSLPRSNNPDEGFVGDPNDEWGYTPPYSYGVHADPVARLLRNFGLDAHAGQGLSWDEIRAEVAAGHPVIVWVIGSIWTGKAKEYSPSEGEKVIVAALEHTMILIGYDQTHVQLVDAFTGLTVTHPVENFLESWAVLGNMAVVGRGPKDSDESASSDEEPVESIHTVQPGDTLGKLANRWDVGWQEIATINQISYPYKLHIGQELIIPSVEESTPVDHSSVDTGAVRIVQSGEHLMQIARELDMDWHQLADVNGLVAPYLLFPGDVLHLQSNGTDTTLDSAEAALPDLPESYITQRNESLFSLAHHFDLSWVRLAALNQLSFPYMLSPGQTVQLK